MEYLTSRFRRTPLALAAAAAAVTFALDQWSKWLVVRELGPEAGGGVVTIVPGVLRLFFVRNTGSAFGLFQGGSDVLKFLALAAVVALIVYFARAARSDWVIALALGLQVGGALGNLADRFRRGYVVDWIDLPRWPTFNLADSAITVGVALLLYGMLFRTPEHGVDREHNPRAKADRAEP